MVQRGTSLANCWNSVRTTRPWQAVTYLCSRNEGYYFKSHGCGHWLSSLARPVRNGCTGGFARTGVSVQVVLSGLVVQPLQAADGPDCHRT